MTTVAVRQKRFSAGFTLAVAIVFAVQVSALFWFNRAKAVSKPAFAQGPTIKLADSYPAELAALEDPTLFVLPNVRSFPDQSWIRTSEQPFEPKVWDEPLRWLKLSPEKLGATFVSFVQSLPVLPKETISLPEPALTYPNIPFQPIADAPSQLRIEGDLAGRRLLNYPMLPAQANLGTTPVTNSVVQVLVDPRGNVLSALSIEAGSGSADADDDALEIAKSLRFESIEASGPDRVTAPKSKLTFGNLIFDWQTLPSTNAPVIP